MPRHILLRGLSLLAALGLFLVFGCSSDSTDPIVPGDPVDETAPLVVDLDPHPLESDVPLDAAIQVRFTEPMDPASVAAALTLSHGTVVDVTWSQAGNEALITHTPWPEGTPVTLTVGSSAADPAGNTLPQAFGTTFYTRSSLPVMIDHDFFSPSTAVPPNGYFIIQFSHPMDLFSIFNAATVTENPPLGAEKRAVPGIRVGTFEGDYSRVKIIWDGELTPLSRYAFTLSTDAETREGTNLSEEFTLYFTAGAANDETPPYILSTSPALDSVVAPGLKVITVTFSEPIDPGYREPGIRSGLLDMFMPREPVWNAAGDEMTAYLMGDLPEGVRFYAIWESANLYDMCGNWNPTPDSLSFFTSGEASLLPVREDLFLFYQYSDDDKAPDTLMRQSIQNVRGDMFERVLDRFTDTGYDEEWERWYMRTDARNILLRGFREDGDDLMLDPAVTYLPHPMGSTWNGTTRLTVDGQTVDMAYSATASDPERVYWGRGKVSGGVYLDNCRDVELTYTMTPVGGTQPVQTGMDYLQLCPGLGILYLDSEGETFDEGVQVDSWYNSLGLYFVSFDDDSNPPR